MGAESEILSYLPLPLLTVVLAAIWFAGLSNVWSKRNDGSSKVAHLALMAVLISLFAAGAFLVVQAALPAEWGLRNLSKEVTGETCENPAESYVFSFGLERTWCQSPSSDFEN